MSDSGQIKDNIDIVDFISEYIQLKPAGSSHKGLCPFHNEKTPSFMVNRERSNWHCFGCGKGGDIFTFLEEIEGMEFIEALKFLADKAGIRLSGTVGTKISANQKNRLKDINKAAARFYHNFLVKMNQSEKARSYLEDRGLSMETIEDWQVGFAPDQWDLLTKYLLKKGYSIDDLVAVGLTVKRDNANAQTGRGFYDRFRDRIMFPISDVHGTIIGFTGRLLEKKEGVGKYVNTPQTILFDKSKAVYGLNRAKTDIKAGDETVLVEGQMDVIACHQAGMKNVVAASGTALTQDHIKLIGRYSKNITMSFDADEAGEKAARRGIEIALAAGIRIKVIQLPEGVGEDPDECLKNNPDEWFKAVKGAKEVMDWYFERAFARHDSSAVRARQAIADELLSYIGLIPFAVEKDHYLTKLADMLAVEVSVLREDLVRLKKNNTKRLSNSIESASQTNSNKTSKLAMLVDELLVLLLCTPNIDQKHLKDFFAINLSTEEDFSLYFRLKNYYTKANKLNIEGLSDQLSDVGNKSLKDKLNILLMKGEVDFSNIPTEEREKEFVRLLVVLDDYLSKLEKKHLSSLIKEAEHKGDNNEVDRLLNELNKLSRVNRE